MSILVVAVIKNIHLLGSFSSLHLTLNISIKWKLKIFPLSTAIEERQGKSLPETVKAVITFASLKL